jgi:hypothetical protein
MKIIIKEIFDDNMVFHTKTQITSNKNNLSKIYNNVLVKRDDNFNDLLNFIDGEEEIEEIKFKLKRKKKMKRKGITVTKLK